MVTIIPQIEQIWSTTDCVKLDIFDKLNSKFCEPYHPTELIAVDEVIVAFKGRVVFRQNIPKKQTVWDQNL